MRVDGPIARIAVLGGGLMGAGIAHVFAQAGCPVRVYEPDAAARAAVVDRVASSLRSVKLEAEAARRVVATASIEESVRDAEFVFEAAPEKLELKQALFAELVRCAPAEAILASNTSVIPIHRIVGRLPTAGRMLGTHWWNPPYLVPLVEVVQSAETSSPTVERVMQLLHSVGKQPVHVRKDIPGFVANRLQHALWREAIAMVAAGVCDAESVDRCVRNSFGLRLAVLGPLENADMVGLDLTLDIHRTIIPELDRLDVPNPYLEQKVAAGELGFKTGRGFREWSTAEMQALRDRVTRHLLDAATRGNPNE